MTTHGSTPPLDPDAATPEDGDWAYKYDYRYVSFIIAVSIPEDIANACMTNDVSPGTYDQTKLREAIQESLDEDNGFNIVGPLAREDGDVEDWEAGGKDHGISWDNWQKGVRA